MVMKSLKSPNQNISMISQSRTDDRRRRSRGAAWGRLAIAWLCLVQCACSSGDYEPDHADLVTEAVSNVSDAAGHADSFRAAFVEGAAPPEEQRRQYGRYSYDATDVAIVSDKATVRVIIISPFDDQKVGEAEWTCEFKAGKWRMQKASLPASLQ
jgi:hypothetical protein